MHFRSYALVLLGVTVTAVSTMPTLTPTPGPTPPAKRQQQQFSVLPPQPTRLATQSQDGQALTASLVTTTVTQYQNIRRSLAVPDADPPMIIYPRQAGALIAGAIAVVGIIAGQNRLDSSVRLEPVTLESMQGDRPAIAGQDDPGCPQNLPACNKCSGNTLALCTSGALANCPCQPENKCPSFENRPKCLDPNCKGDELNRCTTGPNVGCSCKGPSGGIPIDDPFDSSWLDTQQQVLALFGQGTQTCSQNNVQNLPAGLLMGVGSQSPNQLLFDMRQVLCNNQCQQIPNLPSDGSQLTQIYPSVGSDTECEISIAIQNNIEAWIYRGTPANGTEQQQCWDATEQLINNCIQNQGNTGWSNGPDDYQFYQLGFRPLNGAGSKHTTRFTGNDYLKDSFAPICRTTTQSPKVLGNIANVKSNANNVCQALKNQKVVMNANNNQLPDGFNKISQIPRGTSNGDMLVFSLVWSQQACKDPSNPTNLDFTTYSMDTCVQNYVDNLGAKCSNGGSLSVDCAIWSVNAS